MLKAYFVSPTGFKTPAGKDLSVLLIDRDRLKISDHVGVHERHTINYDGKTQLVMRIESPCVVHLERDSERSAEMGPFDELTLVDGMLLGHLDAEAPLARFEYSMKSWIDPKTMIVWERVIITSTADRRSS